MLANTRQEGVRGSEGIDLLFPKLGTGWKRLVSLTPRPLYLWWKIPCHPFYREVRWHSSRSRRCGEDIKLLLIPGFKPRILVTKLINCSGHPLLYVGVSLPLNGAPCVCRLIICNGVTVPVPSWCSVIRQRLSSIIILRYYEIQKVWTCEFSFVATFIVRVEWFMRYSLAWASCYWFLPVIFLFTF